MKTSRATSSIGSLLLFQQAKKLEAIAEDNSQQHFWWLERKGGYEGFTDRYVDLRVDDSPHPIDELKRVFKIYDMTMLSREDPSNLVPIAGNIAVDVAEKLGEAGVLQRLNQRRV